MNPSDAIEAIEKPLSSLPYSLSRHILEHLRKITSHEPVIGIMGKSGTGKSSLCNAIFQSRICATHPLNGCTRQAHRLTLQLGERRMTLVDLPGIGETPQHDQEYRTLYRQLLPELDLIIWILRADERAYAADITMHQFLLNEGADPSRFLFVLSHADRVFPAEEWNATEKCPIPSAGALTGDGDSPGGNPVPFIISSTLRCCTCRLEPSGVCVADDPRTATTWQPARCIHISGEKTALNRPGNTHNRLLVKPSGKVLTTPLPVSVFRPGCYSFCAKPGTALSTC